MNHHTHQSLLEAYGNSYNEARHHLEAQARAQYQARLARRQAQLQNQHQSQAIDPRYQHNYTVPALHPHASQSEQMAYQQMVAQRANEAQRRQYRLVQNEQAEQITHVLYFDSRAKVCEDSHKMCMGIPSVRAVDVNTVQSHEVPQCVTYLPAIVGHNQCFQGSKCEQYIKQTFLTSKKPTDTRFIDFNNTNYNILNSDREPIENTKLGELGRVYGQWPKFSRDPQEALSQSKTYLKKLEAALKRRRELQPHPEKPIDDRDSRQTTQDQNRAHHELRRRENEVSSYVQPTRQPVFRQDLP